MQTYPINLDIEVKSADGAFPQRDAAPVNARLHLPPDQKMYLSIARFLQTSPRFGDRMFRLDAHRGTMRVDLWEPASQVVLQSASYTYTTAEDREIASLEAAILTDFATDISAL